MRGYPSLRTVVTESQPRLPGPGASAGGRCVGRSPVLARCLSSLPLKIKICWLPKLLENAKTFFTQAINRKTVMLPRAVCSPVHAGPLTHPGHFPGALGWGWGCWGGWYQGGWKMGAGAQRHWFMVGTFKRNKSQRLQDQWGLESPSPAFGFPHSPHPGFEQGQPPWAPIFSAGKWAH